MNFVTIFLYTLPDSYNLFLVPFCSNHDLDIFLNVPMEFLKKNFFFLNFQNGIYNALPSLANLIFSVILGYMADKIILKKYLNKEMVTKIWQIIAFGSMIAALGTMGFFTKKIEICLSIIIVGFGLNSAVNSGHLKNVLDLSQSYSGTVYGFSNGFGNISGFLSPIITGIIIESNPSDPVKWQYVSLIFNHLALTE